MAPLVLATLVAVVILVIVAVAAFRRKDGGGGGPTDACGGACAGALPVCDSATGVCVACTADDTTHCPAGRRACVAGACAECDSAHPCPPASGRACTADGRCALPCYTWTAWDPSSGAPPKNAVGPNTLLPAGARQSPTAPWQLGAVNTDKAGGDYGQFLPAGGAGYAPGEVYYLAVAPGCPVVPPEAADPSAAIAFHGVPVCGDFVTVLPGVSALTPYTSTGCASWAGPLVGKARLLGDPGQPASREGFPEYSVLDERHMGPDSLIDAAFHDPDSIYEEFATVG